LCKTLSVLHFNLNLVSGITFACHLLTNGQSPAKRDSVGWEKNSEKWEWVEGIYGFIPSRGGLGKLLFLLFAIWPVDLLANEVCH